MDTSPLTAGQRESLVQLASAANEKLEEAGRAAASHAFNLGCSVALLPAMIVVLLVFLLERTAWVIAAVVLLLALFAVIGFANLAAFVAQNRTVDRIYQMEVAPEIERNLKQMEISRASFDQVADETLPGSARLRSYLVIVQPAESEETTQNPQEE